MHSDDSANSAYVPKLYAVHCLMGMLCKKSGRMEMAVKHLQRALELNPFLWSAYETLCKLGRNDILTVKPRDLYVVGEELDPAHYFTPEAASLLEQNGRGIVDPLQSQAFSGGAAAIVAERSRSKDLTRKTLSSKVSIKQPPPTKKAKSHHTTKGPESNPAVFTESILRPSEPTEPRNESPIAGLFRIFQILARAYYCFSHFESDNALRILEELPPEQYNTAWVLSIVAQCYFEKDDHKHADRIFRRVRQIEPYRLLEMDIYSSVLWHLRQDKPLSFLGHELLQTRRISPQAWCAVGNLFSLKNDHEAALKCLRRAIQIDPYFTYAYTLLGHEYMYGLGTVYLKLEKYDLAEFHMRKAFCINSSKSVLLLYLGVVLEKKMKYDDALEVYEQAQVLRPNYYIYIYKRAVVLYNLDRCEEALELLETIKDTEPQECNISLLMGRIYKKMGQVDMALRYLTRAQDIYGAKIIPAIKEELEQLATF
ncbi:hypothetical protein HDU97_004639 [Phlyctochytrium planicorne]|nr:hypothetical protein HDU97_004639 [Phlyctochytrium planicorne]